jgi:hypothetical protein
MESKIEATERLRREGRWDEASAFRDEERKRLKAEGLPRREAAEASWQAMIVKFPPLPGHQPAEPPDTGEFFPIGDESNSTANLSRDILWCYAHLDRRKVTPADAPSAGAWQLLTWARENRSRFFETLLPKAMPKEGPGGQCPECAKRQQAKEQTERLIDLCLQFEGPNADELRRQALQERRLERDTIVCPNCETRFPLKPDEEILLSCRLRERLDQLDHEERIRFGGR